MKLLPGPETRAAVLKHPFFLAGLAVVVLLGVLAGVLVLASSIRNNGDAAEPTVVIDPVTTATGPVVERTAVASGVSGTTVKVTTVRAAPGSGAAVLGTMNKGEDVAIDGRTSDSGWFRIVYPPESDLHGWIDATFLTITGDPTLVVVATAEPLSQVKLPTVPPSVATAAASSPTPEATETATATPAGGQLPDLVIGSTPTLSNNRLFVTVVNQGPGAAVGDLVVAIFTPDGGKLLGGATLPAYTLSPGASIDVSTNYEVVGSETLLLIVDPNGTIPEQDDLNNRVTVAVSTGGAPPPAPGADTPPPPVP